jgi:[ribosomal protein S5]-alanine N-acetyltransferase
MKSMVIETERLLLRPPHRRDASAIQQLISAREVAVNLGSVPWPYPRGGAAQWISRTTPGVQFLIVRRDDDEILGNVSLVRDEEHGRAELGYWVGVPHWGRGYMTEAVRAILDHGFRQHELRRIFARVYGHNAASARVCEKAGLAYEGTLREHEVRLGEVVDMQYYGILRREWSVLLS